MKKIVLVLQLSLVLTGCMTSEFVLTGSVHDPLQVDYPVKVILTGNKENIEYEEIGVIRVKQSDMDNLSKAVELAKKEARVKGGDIILLFSSNSKASVSGDTFGVYSTERNSFMFIVGKLNK